MSIFFILMKNTPLLFTLTRLVELDSSLLANHHQPKLLLERANILLELGCYDLALKDNCIAALLENQEDPDFYNKDIKLISKDGLFLEKFYPEKNTAYYDFIYSIIEIDKFFHKEMLDPMLYIHRAGRLNMLGLYHLALRDYKQGIKSLYSYPQEQAIAATDAGMLLNLLGDQKFGWQLYEKRWESSSEEFKNPSHAKFIQPQWKGENNCSELFIMCEQGIGDNIQFIRYAIYLKEQGFDVFVHNNEQIDDFLSFNLGLYNIKTIKNGDKISFSHWIRMMSIPNLLGTDFIPYTLGYLKVEDSYLQKWKEKLPLAKLRVGIVWRGNAENGKDKVRSIPLEQFSKLFSIDADFHCLQKYISDDDKNILTTFPNVYDWHNEIESFFDTSAIVEQMDLIISVDTSVAHLAAAMGKPTWILLNYSPDFRWLLNREDSIWYDSVRLFRQNLDYDWATVIDRVLSEF